MKIKFAHDEIGEYSQGNFHFKNDGQPFDVDSSLAQELLWSKCYFAGEMVNVFERADGAETTEFTAASLKKLGKAKLLEIAASVNADATEDNNKDEIIEKILEKTKGE